MPWPKIWAVCLVNALCGFYSSIDHSRVSTALRSLDRTFVTRVKTFHITVFSFRHFRILLLVFMLRQHTGIFSGTFSFYVSKTIMSTSSCFGMVHSLRSGKGKIFLCAACHAFTPHVNAWKNLIGIVVQIQARG